MKGIIPFLAGLGVRVEAELIRHPTVKIEIGGVSFEVTEQVAQALAQERKAQAEALKARPAVPAELEAAYRREREAREHLAAAQTRVAHLERELAGERAARAADRSEAIRAGVEAAHRELATGTLWRAGPVLDERHRAAWRGPGGHA